MVFSTTFKNISVISWQSVLLLEESGGNHRPVPSHCQTWSHNVVSSTPRMWFEFTKLVFINTYCIGIYKPNFHTTTTKQSHKSSMFQNAVIENVAININRVNLLLVDNSVLKMYLLKSPLGLQIMSLTFIYLNLFLFAW